MSLHKTINIILKKVYADMVINTTIKKNAMRKLVKFTCKKTAFLFDNTMYEQIHCVSIGSPLVPILANIITTELESTIVKCYLIPKKLSFTVVTLLRLSYSTFYN